MSKQLSIQDNYPVEQYKNYPCGGVPDNYPSKGGVAGTGAVKILALPKRGAGASDLCQDFFGGFLKVSQKPYSGITQPK